MPGCLEYTELPGGEAVSFSLRAPYKLDEPNEDALAVIGTDGAGSVLVVADGVGGLPRGEDASRLIVERLREAVANVDTDDPRAAIVSAIEGAHATLIDGGDGAASTVVAVYVADGGYRSIHAGDSVAMVSSQRGHLRYETIAHSPVGYALESGLISEDEAFTHQERHIVSNLVGGDGLHIAVGGKFRLAARDTLLLASDGLTDNLRQGEIIDAIRIGPLMAAGQRLATLAAKRMKDGGKPDDLTFIIYRQRNTARSRRHERPD